MAWEGPQPLKFTFKAAADLSAKQYHFVKLDSNGDVVVCNGATDVPIGVLQNSPISGTEAEVTIVGITKVVADAALATIGTRIGTSADGQADAKILGTDVTEFVCGRTLTVGGGAGEIITAIVNCVAPSAAVTSN